MIEFRTAFSSILLVLTGISAAAAQAPQQQPDQATMHQMEQAGQGGTAMDDQARSRFRVGLSLYQEGRFRESATEFQSAFDLSHRAQLLYNVYLAWRDAGDVPKATEALRGFLGQTPDDGTPERHSLVARLASMEQTVAAQQSQSQQQEQHVNETQAQLEAERQARLEAEERARQAAADRERARAARPLGPSIPGIVVGGVGLAAVVTGLIVGALGLGTAGDLNNMCTMHVCPASATSTRDSARLMTGLGDGLWIGGAGVAVVGLILFLLHVGSSPEGLPPPAAASASCGPTGCSAELTLHL